MSVNPWFSSTTDYRTPITVNAGSQKITILKNLHENHVSNIMMKIENSGDEDSSILYFCPSEDRTDCWSVTFNDNGGANGQKRAAGFAGWDHPLGASLRCLLKLSRLPRWPHWGKGRHGWAWMPTSGEPFNWLAHGLHAVWMVWCKLVSWQAASHCENKLSFVHFSVPK